MSEVEGNVEGGRARQREFWDGRASLGLAAGTNDVIAKQLEVETLLSHAADGMRILDVGCGNGVTAIELATRFAAHVAGCDFSPKMVEAAQEAAGAAQLRGSVEFFVADVQELTCEPPGFDLIMTERVLINLPDWQSQSAAIERLIACLRPGGRYLMCENAMDGLEQVNSFRQALDLPRIDPPWHNRYLRAEEVAQLRVQGAVLEQVQYFGSTYYFLSRVVNAALAAQSGQEPRYDSPINQLALRLPAIGQFGQTTLWIWRRDS